MRKFEKTLDFINNSSLEVLKRELTKYGIKFEEELNYNTFKKVEFTSNLQISNFAFPLLNKVGQVGMFFKVTSEIERTQYLNPMATKDVKQFTILDVEAA